MNQSRQMIHTLLEFQGIIQTVSGPGGDDNHSHMVTIPSNVDGGAQGGGMRIVTEPGPTNAHDHSLLITPEDLVAFHKGQTVTVTTGPDNRGDEHTHSVTFDRTMEPALDPEQDSSEGSINVLGRLPTPRAGKKGKKKRKPTPGGPY